MDDKQVVNLLTQILAQLKENNELQTDILNLFKAYDTEEFLTNEEIRMGIQEG